ncbi:hypothetical protein KQI52_00015 [bacterium]|nr:hypothetical protein [bacterium]
MKTYSSKFMDLREQHVRMIEAAKNGDGESGKVLLMQIHSYLSLNAVLPFELKEYLQDCLLKLWELANHEAAKLPEKRRWGLCKAFHLNRDKKKSTANRDRILAGLVATFIMEDKESVAFCIDKAAQALYEWNRQDRRAQVLATYGHNQERLKTEWENLLKEENTNEDLELHNAFQTVEKAWNKHKDSYGKPMAETTQMWKNRGTEEHQIARERLGLDWRPTEIDWLFIDYFEDQE